MKELSNAFVATRFLLGAREAELLRGLDREPYCHAEALARALAHPDRRKRAEILQAPLRDLMAALEARHVLVTAPDAQHAGGGRTP